MLPILDSYDFACMFGENDCSQAAMSVSSAIPGQPCPIALTREDVISVILVELGANDEAPWVVIGRAFGKAFIAEGGCDYTGWDCHAHSAAIFADSMSELYFFGMTPKQRELFDSKIK